MTPQAWIMVAISVATILLSLGGTLVVIGLWSGRQTEAMKNLADALKGLNDRMGVFEQFAGVSGSDRSQMNARLLSAEKDLARATGTLQAHGERMARVESSVERCAHGEEAINRRLDEVFAQLGTLARHHLTGS